MHFSFCKFISNITKKEFKPSICYHQRVHIFKVSGIKNNFKETQQTTHPYQTAHGGNLWKPVTKKEFQMHRNRGCYHQAVIASLRACACKMWLLKKLISLHCHQMPSLLRDAVYNVRYQPTTAHSCQAISITCRRRHTWTDISTTKILEETFQFIHLQTHIYHLSPVLPTYSVQSHTSGHAVARSSQ